MKKILQSFILLLFACGLLGGLPAAWATHLQGGQMTYRYVSGDTYEITVSLYRDCSPGASTLPTDVQIQATSSCSATGTTATLLPVVGSLTTGIGYCPAIQAQATCNPAQPTYPNYEKQDFRGNISLPPAANWIISFNSCCRPSTGNIPTQDNFRFEATLNNLITVNGVATRVNNTSPLFSSRDIPVPFVIVNQRTSINFTSALEPDGDSLVYELDRPLSDCGVYNPYAPRVGNTAACVSGPLPAAPGTVCFLNCASNQGATFAADNPLPVAVDTVGFCGTVSGQVYYKTVRPRFQLNPTNGQITFTPNLFRPGNTNLGLNKYVVVGKITEYRRLPGRNRRYRVGSVRRDFLVIVIDGSGNTVPTPPVVSVPDPASGAVPTNTADTTRIVIQTCNYAQVRVNFTDPDNFATPTQPASNPLQNLSVTYTGNGTINNDLLLNGDIGTYTLINNGTPTPEARFYFQPSPAFAGQTIRIPLRIEDNACPVKGIQTRIIEIKIVRGNFASAAAAVGGSTVLGATAICRGSSLSLQGRVVRPDSIRRLATNTTQLQVYTFQWTASSNGAGLPAVTNVRNITVTPTATTRYFLRIAPTLGFAQGACGDTTSILVRVATPPVARLVTSNTYVCPGGTATLQASATASGGGAAGPYTYRFQPANGLAAADQTKANPTVSPTATTRYYVTASGSAPTSCADTASVLVRVLPGVVANFTTADSVGLNGQRTNRPPVIFTFRDASVFTGLPQGSATTYRWTYERIRDLGNNAVSGTVTAFGTASATPGPLQLGIAGYYRIRLTTFVSISSGGVTTACTPSVKERIVLVPDLQVPNIITPNGDGQNDVFKVSTVGTTTSKIEIFNRWGRKVYEQAGYANNWGGDNQPAGVYYYLLTDRNGAQTKGWLEVVR